MFHFREQVIELVLSLLSKYFVYFTLARVCAILKGIHSNFYDVLYSQFNREFLGALLFPALQITAFLYKSEE